MNLIWIGCPSDWQHIINLTDFTCLECQHEAVEYDEQAQARIRAIIELSEAL